MSPLYTRTGKAAATTIVDRVPFLGFGAVLEVTLEETEDRRSMWRVVVLPQMFTEGSWQRPAATLMGIQDL